MKRTLVIAVSVVVFVALNVVVEVNANSVNWHKEFQGWMTHWKKNYKPNTNEYNSRLNNYKWNVGQAGRMNAKNPHAQFGATKFSDLSQEEFEMQFLGSRPPNSHHGRSFPVMGNITTNEPHPVFRSKRTTPNAANWDWCEVGVITPVNDQGGCGSCWAFSAMETIESYHALRSGKLVDMSAEQIVDCDTGHGDYGCGGGWPIYAYQYVQRAGGIESASAYPYTASDGSSGGCHFSAGGVVTNVAGISGYITGGEAGLYNQLVAASGGPLSVCVAASTWQNYQGGVLTSCDTDTDHCVQLTGYLNYGTSSAVWRIRNQWGTDWGENGYMRMQIGHNLCNIGDYGTYVATSS